ncbi:MAG: flagellar motor switch protein FliN [Candidatus Eisenbacteria sp.]|nr:flagellar motor switch protein FliN [Candidatus Eisenbacteria bacterium]
MAAGTEEATEVVEQESASAEEDHTPEAEAPAPEAAEASSETVEETPEAAEGESAGSEPDGEDAPPAAEQDGEGSEEARESEGEGSGGDEPGAAESGTQDATGVRRAEFQTLSSRGSPAVGDNMQLLMEVTVPVTVELGGTILPLREILELGPGSIVKLDRPLGEPVDILVNGEMVGRGEVVVVGDQFGIQVTELVDPSAAKRE